MMMREIFILPLVCFGLVGCQTAAEAPVLQADDAAVFDTAKRAVVASLRDPASAQFGQQFQRRRAMGIDVVCGTVNSKNGFGGYTGQTIFAYKVADNRVIFAGQVDNSDPLRPALTLCT